MTEYQLHPEAIIDLDDILGWIADESPGAAHRVASEIDKALRTVSRFPQSGHLRPDLTSRPLRFHIVREYLIAYAPRDPLWVIAVLHGRRNPRIMASILQGRK